MILVIDNYDSFAYNLVQMIGEILKEQWRQEEIRTVRNDAMTVEEVLNLRPSYLVLSPGPGKPQDAGICERLVKEAAGQMKILGVCLGHQAICEAFGAKITYAKKLMHGKQSKIKIDTQCDLMKGIEQDMIVGRYHSLIASKEEFPKKLKVIARDKEDEIMAVKHENYEIYGLQFHPESILTPQGKQILTNYLNLSKGV